MKKTVINGVFLASLLSLGLPSLAVGASPSWAEEVEMKVSISDLDVDSEAGARILYARLRHASKDACGVGSLHELGSLKRFSKAKGCSEAMIEAAVKKIDSDALQEIHSS
jgi:UrcA family protein